MEGSCECHQGRHEANVYRRIESIIGEDGPRQLESMPRNGDRNKKSGRN
jgi:hypothetical protein